MRIIPGVNEVVNVNVIKRVAVCLSSWWPGKHVHSSTSCHCTEYRASYLQKQETYFQDCRGKCPVIVSSFGTTTTYLSVVLVGTRVHQHFPNCCCPYILVYVVASITTSHLFSTWCDLLK